MNNRDKLFKLMQENPDLPIVFSCSTEEMSDDYAYMFYEDFSCDVVTIYKTDETIYDDEDDIKEYYEYIYEDEYEGLSDEEFNANIQDLINNTEHYKAIRIYCKY